MARSNPASPLPGVRIRERRLQLGIPQDKLGVMIGIDEGSSSARMSRYEAGVHAPPVPVAKRVAEALEVPLAYLYCDDDFLAEVLLAASRLKERERDELLSWIRSQA